MKVQFADVPFDTSKLATSMLVRWNRHVVPKNAIQFHPDHFTFAIEPAWFEAYPDQRIEFRHSDMQETRLPIAKLTFIGQG